MTNTVLLKRSSVANSAPLAGNLAFGELAINYTDGNLFYKNASGTVTVLASNQFLSVVGNVTSGNVINSGVVSTSGIVASGNVNLTSSGNISLGAVGNVHITGGSSGYVLSTNGSGTLSWVAQSGSGNLSVITVDDFTGNGVQTDFTLSVTPGSIDQTTVNYNGVIQLRTGYSLSGANIVFTTAPVANSSIEVTTISPAITGAAGSNTQIQFNDSGNTGASSNLTFNKSTNVLGVTGNVDSGNLRTSGLISATGNIIGGNLSVTNISGTLTTASQTNITSVGTLGSLTVTANVVGGNILTGGLISATSTITSAANVVGGNITTAGQVSATANVTGGNILTVGIISATGNITGNYFVGNGSQLTGIAASPAGSNTQIQFNDGGVTGASANLTFDKSTNTLNATTVTANGVPLATTGKAIAMAIVFGF